MTSYLKPTRKNIEDAKKHAPGCWQWRYPSTFEADLKLPNGNKNAIRLVRTKNGGITVEAPWLTGDQYRAAWRLWWP